jgi:kojibiose phosphorylase
MCDAMNLQALIFDLDGVLVETADYHYRSWQLLAAEEGLDFTWDLNEQLRSISRRASLEIILRQNNRVVDAAAMTDMLERKNRAYLESLQGMDASSLLPGAVVLIGQARAAGLKLAVASASRNAEAVLLRTGIYDLFDLVMDGNSNLPSKPAPDLFVRVAQRLGIAPGNCAVLEDALVGIDAALAAGMWSVGLGPAHRVGHAHVRFDSLEGVTLAGILAGLEQSRG